MVLLLLLTPTVGHSATKYACGTGQGQGAMDGSSLANCYNGAADVWSTGAPSAGDTVIICGTARTTTLNNDMFRILVNMTYKLGSSAECGALGPGKVFGSQFDDGTGWTYDGANNDYRKVFASAAGNSSSTVMYYADASLDPMSLVPLHNAIGVTTRGNMVSGDFYWDSATNTVYMRDNPAGRSWEISVGYFGVAWDDVAGITDATVIGGDTACSDTGQNGNGFFVFASHGIGTYYDNWPGRTWGTATITRVLVNGAYQGIHAGGPPGSSEYSKMTVTDACIFNTRGEGYYFNYFNGGPLRITGGMIGSSKWPKKVGWGSTDDAAQGDAIDINPPDNANASAFDSYVADVVISDTNGACVSHTGQGLVERIRCTRTGNLNNTAGGTYALLMQNAAQNAGLSLTFRSIRVDLEGDGDGVLMAPEGSITSDTSLIGVHVNLGSGSTRKALAVNKPNRPNLVILNSSFMHGTYGFAITSATNTLQGWKVINNIFENQDFPLYGQNTSAVHATFIGRNNNFRSKGTQSNPFKFHNTDYATKTALQAVESSWVSNIEGNPLFVSSTDFRLALSSTLRRAGVPGYVCKDARGRACDPDQPDIGAYQSTDGDVAGTRTSAGARTAADSRTSAGARTVR